MKKFGNIEAVLHSLEKRISKIEEIILGKAKEKRIVKPHISPVIYRHNRYLGENYVVEARGGVTYAFQINYINNLISVGLAVCSKKDNFNKHEGRRFALERLKNEPIVFKSTLSVPHTLVEKFWVAVQTKNAIISKTNENVLKAIDLDKIF